MLFVVFADVLEQPERTRYMYLLASIPHVTTLVAPLCANLFMRINIWIPFTIAMAFLVSGLVVISAMPESLISSSGINSLGSADSTSTLLNNDRQIPPEDDLQQIVAEEETAIKEDTHEPWFEIFKDIAKLVQAPGMLLYLGRAFFRPIALVSRAFVYQHASESFGWSMSSTTWLRFTQAISSAFVTLIFLPLLSTYLNRKEHRARKLDLNVIRISLFLASIGFTLIWQSRASWMLMAGLFVHGLGEGFEPSIKGLATSLLEHHFNARLLTLVAVLEVIAKLIGGPLMARLFSIRRKEDHETEGFCYLASALLLLLLAGSTLIARVRR